jgi:hypothetical protein
MPEREISDEQFRAISDWIYDVKGGSFVRRLQGDDGVWKVDEEPIVIHGKDDPIYDEHGDFDRFGPSKKILFCSDKHAKELEEAGIVNFSEVESPKT